MLAPIPVAFLANETHLLPYFIVPAAIALALGFFLRRRFQPTEITLGKAMVLVASAWVVFAAFGSVPYVFGNNMSAEDAYFESMSGFTATGLTMIPGDPIATNVVISEVGLLGPAGGGFIELYNPTGSDINLQNLYGGGEKLRVRLVNSSDNVSTLNITWMNFTIPANGYFLFASDNAVDNIAADATFFAQFDNSGGVIIDNDIDLANGVIDRVGWGAGAVTNATEGTKVSNNLTAGDSLERRAWGVSTAERMMKLDSRRGNGYETNNNANDFVFHRGFRAPQNSSSAREAPIRNVEACPRTILFWRSLTEWVGGMGVIVLFLAALIGAGRAARKMYVAEARAERIEPSIRETARSLWKIYVLLTLLGIVGLYFAGAPNISLFEAVNHSMTGIATGGFSVRNTSFAGYGSPVLGITILIMMAGAISFAIHRRVMAGQWRDLFRNIEVRLMFVLIALATLLLIWSVGLRHALFQSTSALTGTGFSTATLSTWGDPQKGLLAILMVIGGGYGSTSSAIKLIRTVIIVKSVHWMIKRSFLPQRAVVPMKISGRIYTEQEMMETAIYAFLYIIVLITGAIVLMAVGNPAMNSVFESASAQGNVGLSVGITSAAMPLAGKISMTVQMLVGRLEIIPVVAFVSYLIAKVPRPRRKPF